MKKLILLLLPALISCRNPEMTRIEGETMGTTYHITYFDPANRNFKTSIDSIFILVNRSINTYDPTSEISVFNKSQTGIKFKLPYFLPPLEKSFEVYQASHGAFDPTVMPLVNAWGFGPDKQELPDSAKIDSLRSMVGFEKIGISYDSIWKTDPRAQLDFGGIGQGYGADVISNFLKSKGVENMFVELGGEGTTYGHNTESGKPWRVAILDPENPGAVGLDAFKAYVSLSDRAFTTSGNYYNYRIVNEQKFSHTIDPRTGYPVQHTLLSATVFAADAATADAWDTALMVMGYEKSIETLEEHPELDAFLIYSTPEGTRWFATEGISNQIEINK
jgi:thiamine biosynthesis lipoprotein